MLLNSPPWNHKEKNPSVAKCNTKYKNEKRKPRGSFPPKLPLMRTHFHMWKKLSKGGEREGRSLFSNFMKDENFKDLEFRERRRYLA